MRAAVHEVYGPPEVVSVRDVPRPEIGSDELLVMVRATTVNRTDCHYRSATPFPMRFLSGLRRPKVSILGTEFAGQVAAVGAAVSSFAVGERVFGYVEGRFGAHAEYLAVRASGLVARIPERLSFEEAAPGTEASHYALSHLRKAGVTSGHEVLVYGASGGIGSAAVQLAKALGATVTAVCATNGLGMVASLGPDRVVDYTSEDFTRDEQRYDLVFDAWGMLPFATTKHLIKPSGIFMSTGPGPHLQNLYRLPLQPLVRGRRVVFAPPKFDAEMLQYLAGLLADGRLTPMIDRRYTLEEIVEAYRFVETGQKLGNVVIVVADDGDAAASIDS
jgi:NADPH:quinone reductase-like Zn-dependent oxidoreductase